MPANNAVFAIIGELFFPEGRGIGSVNGFAVIRMDGLKECLIACIKFLRLDPEN